MIDVMVRDLCMLKPLLSLLGSQRCSEEPEQISAEDGKLKIAMALSSCVFRVVQAEQSMRHNTANE